MSSNKQLPTIDLAQLATVSGGAGSSEDTAVMTALSGILDSLGSLAKSKQSGFGTSEMLMMMMMMQSRPQVVTAAAPAQPTNWTWDANGGYWIVK